MGRTVAGQTADHWERIERAWSPRHAAYLTIAMGAVHALLFRLSYWMLSGEPGPRASDAQVVAFYQRGAQRRPILVGLYLMPFAGIAFIWFIVALRMWVSGHVRRENAMLSNIQLVSGIVYVALFFAAAASSSAAAASVECSRTPVNPAIVRQFPQFGFALLFGFAMRMAAMFVFTTSNIARSAGILPRWFAYLGFAVGLFLLLSATLSPFLVLVFPLWLLALCALVLRWARTIPADAVVGSRPDQLAP